MSKHFKWPLPVRITHWSVATLFLANHFITEGGEQIHEYVGWAIATLVGLRLIYGLTLAPKPARLRDLIPSPQGIKRHWIEISRRLPVHDGHNAFGAVAVWLIWTLLLLTAFTGWFQDTDPGFEYGVYEWHTLLADSLLYFIALHITAVVLTSIRLRLNLMKSMF